MKPRNSIDPIFCFLLAGMGLSLGLLCPSLWLWIVLALCVFLYGWLARDWLVPLATSFFVGVAISVKSNAPALDVALLVLVPVVVVSLRTLLFRLLPAIVPTNCAGILLQGLLTLLAIVVVASSGLSAADYLSAPGSIMRESYPAAAPIKKRVGVALSGGGYRAALLHVGVLDALRHFQIPVTSIASVSGGSIAASAYAAHVDPKAFVNAVVNGRFNLYRKLLDIQFVYGYAFVFPGDSRRRAQAELLDDAILGTQSLGQLAAESHINLMMISSDLDSGESVGVTSQGILTRLTIAQRVDGLYTNEPDLSADDMAIRIHKESSWVPTQPNQWPSRERASTIAASSGAFPVAFEPLPIGSHYLADGGITDNSAMTLLMDAEMFSRRCDAKEYSALRSWQQDLIVASDGSEPFPPADGHYGLFGATRRAAQIASERVTPQPFVIQFKTLNAPRVPTILLSPGDLVYPQTIAHETEDLFFQANHRHIAALLKGIAQRQGGDETIREIIDLVLATPAQIADFIPGNRLKRSSNERREYVSKPSDLYEPFFSEIIEVIKQDSGAFYNAGTLKSDYSRDEAFRIYRLGWLLVALNSAALEDAMESPSNIGVEPTGKLCPTLAHR